MDGIGNQLVIIVTEKVDNILLQEETGGESSISSNDRRENN